MQCIRWLPTTDLCIHREEISSVKNVLALNLSLSLYRPGALCFHEFSEKGCDYVMNTLLQAFLKLGQMIYRKSLDTGDISNHDAVMFFVESVLKNPESTQNAIDQLFDPSCADAKFTDITLYIITTDPQGTNQIDVNKLWGELFTEIQNFHKKEQVVPQRVTQKLEIKSNQKYLNLRDVSPLAKFFDTYQGTLNASNFSTFSEAFSLNDVSHPLRATSYFSPLGAFKTRSDDCIPSQSLENFRKIFTIDGETISKVCFPNRKFLIRVTPSAFDPDYFPKLMLPHIQRKTDTDALSSCVMSFYDVCFNQVENNGISNLSNTNELDEAGDETGSEDDDDPGNQIVNALRKRLKKMSTKDDNSKSNKKHKLVLDIATELRIDSIFDQVIPFSFKDLTGSTKSYSSASHSKAIMNYESCYIGILDKSVKIMKMIDSMIIKLRKNNGYIHGKKVNNINTLIRKLIIMQQLSVINAYEACNTPEADLSRFEKGVVREIQEKDLFSKKYTCEKEYYDFMPFSNYEIQQAIGLLTCFQMGTGFALAECYYRYSSNSYNNTKTLHFGTISFSESGETGKSFGLEVLCERIPSGVIEKESTRSNKTDTGDETNLCGRVIIIEELDPKLIRESKAPDGSGQERLLKEGMTSQEINAKRLVFDKETNSYINKVIKIFCVSTIFAATNANMYDKNMISPSMASRFEIHYSEMKKSASDRTVFTLKMAEESMTPEERVAKTDFIEKDHLIHAMMFTIERLIWLQGLNDVSCHVSMAILMIFQHKMTEKKIKGISTRTLCRAKMLSRIHAIIDAILTTFFVKGAKYYGKKKIELLDFQALDRKLYVQSHHIVSALGLQISQFGDKFEIQVQRAIAGMAANKGNGYIDSKFKNDIRNDNKRTMDRDFDYNLFGFKISSLDQFCKRIQSFAESEWGMSLPHETCEKTIESWKLRNIKGNKYQLNPELANIPQQGISNDIADDGQHILQLSHMIGSNIFNFFDSNGTDDKNDEDVDHYWEAGYKSIMERVVRCNEYKTVTAAEQSKMCIYFHRSLFEEKLKTPREVIIDMLQEIFEKKHQLPRMFLFDSNQEHEFVRNVIHVQGDNGSEDLLAVPKISVLHSFAVELSQDLTDEEISDESSHTTLGVNQITYIDMDIDVWGNEERNAALFITEDPIDSNYIGEVYCGGEASGFEDWYSDNDYDDQVGYFMGMPLKSYYGDYKSSGGILSKDRIHELIDKLDKTRENTQDYDFNPNDFKIPTEDGRTKFHWEFFPVGSKFSDPKVYKMVCYVPFIMNNFFNLVNKTPQNRSNYPDKIINFAKKHMQNRWDKISQDSATTGAGFKNYVKSGESKTYGIDERGRVIKKRSYQLELELLKDVLCPTKKTKVQETRVEETEQLGQEEMDCLSYLFS